MYNYKITVNEKNVYTSSKGFKFKDSAKVEMETMMEYFRSKGNEASGKVVKV